MFKKLVSIAALLIVIILIIATWFTDKLTPSTTTITYWLNVLDKLLNNLISLTKPTWPQLCLTIGLLVIFLFRTNIASLIDRAKKISKNGLDFHPAQQAPKNPLPKKAETSFQHLTSIKTIENNIKFIQNYIDERDFKNSEELQQSLVEDLAKVCFIFRCERIYNIIFESQLRLLRVLLDSKATGLTDKIVNLYFEHISKCYPDVYSEWDAKLYVNFLIEAELMDKENGNYKITDFGADFLTWFQDSGKTACRNINL